MLVLVVLVVLVLVVLVVLVLVVQGLPDRLSLEYGLWHGVHRWHTGLAAGEVWALGKRGQTSRLSLWMGAVLGMSGLVRRLGRWALVGSGGLRWALVGSGVLWWALVGSGVLWCALVGSGWLW